MLDDEIWLIIGRNFWMRSTDPKLKSKVIVNLTVIRVRQTENGERKSERERNNARGKHREN